MKIGSETKIFLGILVVTVVIIGAALAIFSKPEATFKKEELVPANATAVGPRDAKVFLVEFSDFQCPACEAFKPHVDVIKTEYKDRLLFVYRHFPLPQHQFAQKAAYAAEAAGKQEKFWEMYDFLFSNSENLSDEKILEGAKLLSLDMSKFKTDSVSDEIKNKITQDIQDGQKFGVDGTPTFYLNGKELTLSSFSDLKKAVDEAFSK